MNKESSSIRIRDVAQSVPPPHPRTIGWVGTTALAMGGSNQSLFLIGALIASQGSAAVPLLIVGLLLSLAAAPGWTELILMWPNRVGGIAATCAEAFRPYSPVLANLAGVCYWWGWVPTCGLTAILSATALHEWYLPGVPVPILASALVLLFTGVNLCGVRWVTRLALPIATVSASLAFLSGLAPLIAGHVNWHQATTVHLLTPFHGMFGQLTSAMAGLYLVGFAAPAFEAAACHVGETVDPGRNVPRAMFASAVMATVYFVVLPVIWLGMLGAGPLQGNLQRTLGPTFAPLFGDGARTAAIWFMMFNMFHGTLQPLAGASRTIMQIAEDGLLPRIFALRSRTDAPWVATLLTAGMAIVFLLIGDPTWVIAAANLAYLIGIALPNVAVWLLRRDAPGMTRPYRAPRGTIVLGLLAAGVWGISTVLGFEQFGLPTVLTGLALCYSATALYAIRRWTDRREAGLRGRGLLRSLHLKLTGAMLLVLALDGAGYLLAVSSLSERNTARITGLEDIFVAVALLTVSVGLVLPGMVAHGAGEVARAANWLATGTLADLRRAMQALSRGDLDAAHARVDMLPVTVRTRDEMGAMAASFNTMQQEVAGAALALDGAREGLRQAQTDTRSALERLEAVIKASPLPIIAIDVDGTVEAWNPAAQHTFGWSEEEVRGLPVPFVPQEQQLLFSQNVERLKRGEALKDIEGRLCKKGGSQIDVGISGAPLRDADGTVRSIMAVIVDITERKRAEKALEHQALHDALTGLPNRLLFHDRLEQAIRFAHRGAASLALLLLDLDRFKEVNDTLGHQPGDVLLQEVGQRLRDLLRESDTVARLGGDEFAIILPAIDAPSASLTAGTIHSALRQPLVLEGHRININASMGIALYPEHGEDTATLLRHADIAMYTAKRAGVEHQIYAPDQDLTSPARLELMADLRHAIDHDQLLLHYQPKVNMATSAVEQVEALVRWLHPEHGLIAPTEFIPLAEETGLIEPLTLWVLRSALDQCAAWQQAGLQLRVAVNLSTRNLHDPHLADTIAWMVRSEDVEPSRLIVEITESALMQDPDGARAVLQKLHEMGVGIAIDDFGTGYSSLAYLKQLPVDEIKIDRSFVQGMTHNGLVIVRSVIDLGRNLGLEVTAEGVETQDTWNALARMGCSMAQGYYLSRPLPFEEVIPWITTFSRTAEQTTTRGNVILVVDDNPVYQELLQVLLTNEGYEVMTAGSAEEALATLERVSPDLILTDVQLPGLDGLELVRRIRTDRGLQHAIIVALTGSPRPKDEKRARSAGCNVYAAKPSSNADLLRLVRQHLAA